jgi:hypothetical protein
VAVPKTHAARVEQSLAAFLPQTPWEEPIVDTFEKFFGF